MADDEDFESEEAGGPGAAPDLPSPRENPLLLGQESAEAALLQAFTSGRMSHAWLLTGPRGIGKATLAYRFARFLLAEGDGNGNALFAAPPVSLVVAPEHQAFRLTASGSHPDLLVVERGVDPKRRRLRREILADEARSVAEFLHLTASLGGWRVVVVDGADAMNPHAANGLLKILEEPPKRAILLLVSDNPGRLLPTIRSRCRTLPLKPLTQPVMIKLFQSYRPDLSESDRGLLLDLAEGSIGRAVELAAGDGTIYKFIISLLDHLPHFDPELIHGFAEGLARAGGEEGFALFSELLPAQLAQAIARAAGRVAGTDRSFERRLARAGLDQAGLGQAGLDQWVVVWEKLTHLFAQADGINLDRKQAVLNAVFALEEAAR